MQNLNLLFSHGDTSVCDIFDIMTLLHFYLTCVPDCTLIKNKLIVLPDDNNAKSSVSSKLKLNLKL